MGTTRLFVYGTLKRGLRNHHMIAAQEYLGEALTEPKYRVIDLGPHPGLIVDETNGLSVRGELWLIGDACLGELDAFEEVPGPFIRAEVRLQGIAEPAHAYLWNRPIPEGSATGSEWPM